MAAHANTVSHLGATEPADSVVLQPSAAIFDVTTLVTGAMILTGAWFALDAFRSWAPMVELGEGGLERWIVDGSPVDWIPRGGLSHAGP